jgi:hypothetical protein
MQMMACAAVCCVVLHMRVVAALLTALQTTSPAAAAAAYLTQAWLFWFHAKLVISIAQHVAQLDEHCNLAIARLLLSTWCHLTVICHCCCILQPG